MSASVLLYSSHRITEEELAEVIRQAGGVLTPELVWFGRISHEWTHVWIDRIPCYDGVFDDDGTPFNEQDLALLEQAKVLLGGEFQTWISIILSRTSGSQRLPSALLIPVVNIGCALLITIRDGCLRAKRSSNCTRKKAHIPSMDY